MFFGYSSYKVAANIQNAFRDAKLYDNCYIVEW